MLARIVFLFGLLIAGPAVAADNATLLTPCASGCVTMRSKDIGGGVQSMIQILGDTSGNAIYGTAGTANANVLSVQGIASGTALAVSSTTLSTKANQDTNAATTAHTCSTAGYSELGCLGQIDDDVKATGTIKGAGSAGTADAGVVTIQGIASMTKLLVTPDSVALPANQSVNLNQVGGAALPKGGVGVVNGGSFYQHVAASQTGAVLQSSTGAAGDYLSHCVIYPSTTAAGSVTVFDNTNAAGTNVIEFVTGTLSNLAPISVPVGAVSTAGAWKVTTGANETVVCFGKFS